MAIKATVNARTSSDGLADTFALWLEIMVLLCPTGWGDYMVFLFQRLCSWRQPLFEGAPPIGALVRDSGLCRHGGRKIGERSDDQSGAFIGAFGSSADRWRRTWPASVPRPSLFGCIVLVMFGETYACSVELRSLTHNRVVHRRRLLLNVRVNLYSGADLEGL